MRHSEPDELFFTLALDRILSLELSEETFEYENDFAPAGWFKDCFGIVNDTDVPVEKVVIRAFGKEMYYLRDLPLHYTQREISTMENYADFELTLRPTADFFSPLMSRGQAIKVLQPAWIAEEMKRLHMEAAKLYE